MKGFLVGCLVVVAVLVVGGGTLTYFFVVKPAYEFAVDLDAFQKEFAAISGQIDQTGPYAAPADGQVTPEQFQRFLVAQREIREHMADRFEALKEKFDAIDRELEGEGRLSGLGQLVSGYRDLGDLLLVAKRAQVEALNRYNFSLQEYYYVRNQTYLALGQDVAVAALGDQAQPRRVSNAPESVVQLVAPHRDELMEGYVFAWFGI
ncbi:MAG: hypothetical protein HND55_00425 [Pseudomonadota bacterium]|nr:MAG: hypothetical protein HND55_00425 [Pseudomonadota bacterium]